MAVIFVKYTVRVLLEGKKGGISREHLSLKSSQEQSLRMVMQLPQRVSIQYSFLYSLQPPQMC
jgi:hypothetical protein